MLYYKTYCSSKPAVLFTKTFGANTSKEYIMTFKNFSVNYDRNANAVLFSVKIKFLLK